jgi:hypothetical protein
MSPSSSSSRAFVVAAAALAAAGGLALVVAPGPARGAERVEKGCRAGGGSRSRASPGGWS